MTLSLQLGGLRARAAQRDQASAARMWSITAL